ncbi:zinc-regulated protein 8-like [Ostrinia furnacalis]|uniref:zinc-regulated protein 8-like n=1 Tax=Ostrinia furnacalis TaxID=93504 RepID=UPI00103C4584|nr:zinc-regulated protein 8-like [Ostrinia furnacalis]
MGNESVVDQIVNSLSFEVEAVPQDDDKLASTSNTTPLNVKIRKMGNESVVDQIVNSLSFEVEAVPQDDDKLASTSNTTPLNVKIRVRKKNESRIQHGVLSVPKFGRPDAQPERIRVISSDQTIMSFNMSMEANLVKKPKRKPRKSLFARCLGTQYDDDEMPYAPSTAYNAKVSDANTTSKSDGVIRQNFTLSKTNYDNADDLQIHTKKHGILGKCKPGGCLDPPFGEEKYSYEPTQKVTLKKMPGITEDKVEKPKKIKVSTMVADQRNINNSNELSKESIGNKTKTKSQDESDSILSLYNNSLEGSLDSKYSDTVITYPPLTNTNSNEKSLRNRISNEEKPRKSFDDSIEAFFSSKTSRLNEKSSNDADDGKKGKAKVIIPVPIPIPLGHVKESEKTQISTQNVPDSVTKKGTLVESDSTVMEEVSEMLETNDAKYNYSQEHTPYTNNIVAPQKNNEELNAQLNVTTADPTVKSQIETSGIQTRPVDLIKPNIVDTPEDKHDISSYHEKHDEVDSYDDDQSTVKKSRTLPNEMPIPVQEKGQTKEHKVAEPLSPSGDDHIMASDYDVNDKMQDDNGLDEYKLTFPEKNLLDKGITQLETDTKASKQNEQSKGTIESQSAVDEVTRSRQNEPREHENIQENQDVISGTGGSMMDAHNLVTGHTAKPNDQNDNISKQSAADDAMSSDYDMNDNEPPENRLDNKLPFPRNELPYKGIIQSENKRTSNIIPSAKAVNASTKDFSETDKYFMENMDVDDTELDTKKPDLNKDYVKNENNNIILQENSSSTDKKISQSNKNLLHNVISNDDDNYDDTEPRKYNTIFESSKEDDDFSPLTDPRYNGLVDGIPANNLQNLDTAIHSSQLEQLNISNSNDGLENYKSLVHNFPDDKDNSDKDIANKMLNEINISEMLTNSSEFMEPITRSSLDEQKIKKSKSIIESQSVKSERNSINYSNSLKYKFKTKSDISRSNYSAEKKSPQVVSKSSLKKNSISLDMAFQSYMNERRERIFKTLDTSVEAVRYPNDSVTVLQSPLSEDSNEIRIPIDLENNMTIQIHRTKSPTQRVQILKQEPVAPDVSFPTLKGKHGLSDFSKTKCEGQSKRWNGKFTGNEISNILHSVYEQELLPLQKTIKYMKKDVDFLISQQSTLVDKLISSKRTKPFRLLKVNSRCVCCRPRVPKVVDLQRVFWSGQKLGVRGCKRGGPTIATWEQSQ